MNSFSWLSWENPVAIWWIGLISISALNMIFWIFTKMYIRRKQVGQTSISAAASHLYRYMVAFSGLYVFGCAYRSFFAKADVQRICLFDTWVSSVFLGRTVATIAELAFILQWAMILFFYGKFLKNQAAQLTSQIIIVLICAAECFSWFAVITTNYLGNTIEESLWALSYTLIGLSLFSFWKDFGRIFKYLISFAVLGCFLYVFFMTTVDVPMYFQRWQQDLANNKIHFSIWQGLIDLNTRWIVTHSIKDWYQEIPWKTLYFTCAVWVSLALCYLPLTEHQLKKYLKNPSRE
jgi:hypothetical protein